MRKLSRLILVCFLVFSVMFATGAAAWAAPMSGSAYQYLLKHPNLYKYLRNNPRSAQRLLGDQWQQDVSGLGQQSYKDNQGQSEDQGYQQFGSDGTEQDNSNQTSESDNNTALSQLQQLMGSSTSDSTSSATYSGTFSDVPTWAQQAVGEMSSRGIIKGLGRGMFGSNQTLTRAQFATLLVREFGLLSTSGSVYGTVDFVDVPSTFWAYKYIEAAAPYMTYWDTGGQATFHPTDPADREDCMVAMVEAAGLANQSVDASSVLSKFADAGNISPNLVNLVAIAVQSGLITGSQGSDGNWYLHPLATLTRAQGAVLLYRALSFTKVAPGGVSQSVYGG